MNIPEGYVLVPYEPTCDQLFAGVKTSGVIEIYKDMVSAAPALKITAYDEAKERELFESEFSYFPEGIWFSKLKGMYLSVNGRIYEQGQASEMNNQWAGWKACAKSRARSAE